MKKNLLNSPNGGLFSTSGTIAGIAAATVLLSLLIVGGPVDMCGSKLLPLLICQQVEQVGV